MIQIKHRKHLLTASTAKVPHPLDLYIGQRLRLRRKLLGMSQSDLAEKVGLTFQQVQKYERGANSTTSKRLYEFAAVLKVSPMFFFDGYGEEGLQLRLADIPTQAIHLVQDYSVITSEPVRKSIAAFVKEIAKGYRHAE